MNDPKTKQEFDEDPRYNGQPTKTCEICHLEILPRGRSAPMGMLGCEHERGGSLWPNETREQFGYTAELVSEAKRLREIFYPPTLSAEQLTELQEDIARGEDSGMPSYDDEAVKIAVAELLRLREQTKPRPMSEAPRSGWFWALMPLRDFGRRDANGHMFKDVDDMDWSANDAGEFSMFAGWLPASGGDEDL